MLYFGARGYYIFDSIAKSVGQFGKKFLLWSSWRAAVGGVAIQKNVKSSTTNKKYHYQRLFLDGHVFGALFCNYQLDRSRLRLAMTTTGLQLPSDYPQLAIKRAYGFKTLGC